VSTNEPIPLWCELVNEGARECAVAAPTLPDLHSLAGKFGRAALGVFEKLETTALRTIEPKDNSLQSARKTPSATSANDTDASNALAARLASGRRFECDDSSSRRTADASFAVRTSRQSSFFRRSPAFEPGRSDGRRPVTEIRRAPRRRAEATVLARTGWRQLLP